MADVFFLKIADAASMNPGRLSVDTIPLKYGLTLRGVCMFLTTP